jgi:hypothetical protein
MPGLQLIVDAKSVRQRLRRETKDEKEMSIDKSVAAAFEVQPKNK